jgi:hypothetical protein
MTKKKVVRIHAARLTHVSDTEPEKVHIDDSARLREIRAFVVASNRSFLSVDTIICQIYMESRFDKDARAQGSSARGGNAASEGSCARAGAAQKSQKTKP